MNTSMVRSSDEPRGRRRDAAADPYVELPGSPSKFALFGEVVLVGAVLAPLLTLVVPAVPALAVGVRHLRRQLEGRPDRLRDMLRELVPATRDLWPVAVALPALLLLLTFNVWLATTGALAGAGVVAAVSAAVGSAALVVGLRTAGGWVPGRRAGSAVRAAARRASADLGGSVLLVAALMMSAAIVWMLVALLLVVGGLLALAVVAVEHRHEAGRRGS